MYAATSSLLDFFSLDNWMFTKGLVVINFEEIAQSQHLDRALVDADSLEADLQEIKQKIDDLSNP